jgi:hypothetical protein
VNRVVVVIQDVDDCFKMYGNSGERL